MQTGKKINRFLQWIHIRGGWMTLAWGLFAVLALSPTIARASSGVVAGTMYFHNRNGGFCPNSDACVGATYKETEWGKSKGIPEVPIQIRRWSDQALLGVGTTDARGRFRISWSSGGGSQPVLAVIRVVFRHKDTRFQMHTIGNVHSQLVASSPPFWVTHGTTVITPQLYSYVFGSAASPNAIANAYWSLWNLWNRRLRHWNRMRAYLDDVDVLAFGAPGVACSGSASCAQPWIEHWESPPSWAERLKTIVLGSGAHVPYSRTPAHELAHVADYVSGPHQGLFRSTSYDRDGKSWNFTSEEYLPVALTEGLADYISISGYYEEYATDPRICHPGDGDADKPENRHCYDFNSDYPNYDVEYSLETGFCPKTSGRWPLNHTRYFWDIADSIDDGRDTMNASMGQILDSIAAYPCPNWPHCYASGELHDQFSFVAADLSGLRVSRHDYNGAWDFAVNMSDEYPGALESFEVYFNNCLHQDF